MAEKGKELSTEVVPESAEGADAHEDIRSEVLKLRTQSDENFWQFGAVLEHVWKSDLYRGWGFESWTDYIEHEVEISMRKAQYLIKLQSWFDTMTPAIQKWLRGLGWTKSRLLMGAVTADNAAEWKNRVAGKTVAEIEAMLKADSEERGSISASAETDDTGVRAAKWSVSLFPAQKEIVELATKKAMEVANSDKQGHALTMVCQEYLATNTTTTSINDMLKNTERFTGLKIVAIRVGDDGEDEVVYGAEYVNPPEEEEKTESAETGE